jgi:shikimate 5-dehydrogenase
MDEIGGQGTGGFAGGREVGQAAAAFQLWFSLSPDQASALEACRAAVAARA